jgi:hypothetical protein
MREMPQGTQEQSQSGTDQARMEGGQSPIYDRTWRWRCNLPERHGTRCRVIARGTMNSAQIEFEDGTRHIVSRFAIRKAPA